ncbi:hypothetical protein LINPERHAP2_LOCUS13284, partial [Linum perenne]
MAFLIIARVFLAVLIRHVFSLHRLIYKPYSAQARGQKNFSFLESLDLISHTLLFIRHDFTEGVLLLSPVLQVE